MAGPTIIVDQTSQILHYADTHEKASDTDTVNAGIYYISTEIYQEYKEEQKIIVEEEKASMLLDPEGNPSAAFDNFEFDIEMTNLEEDYCVLSPQKRLRNASFN